MDALYGWLHPQDPQSVLNDQRSPAGVEPSWKDSNSPPGANGQASSSAQHPALDLGEFDIASGELINPNPRANLTRQTALSHHVPSASSSSSASSAPSQAYPYQQYNYYVPGPYNSTPYGSTQWNPASVPLSSYSSLNGATTSNGQSPSSMQQMIIEYVYRIDSVHPLIVH